MAPSKAKLPVVPLAKDTILLPGIVLRIPVPSDRPDIPALLSSVYSRAASKTPSQRLDNVNVVCVPLNSPLLTQTGQKTISENEQSSEPKASSNVNPSKVSKNDLFGYGVAAKISGVEGRGTGEFALIVEGVARVKIDKVTQETPYFEAEVTYKHDAGKSICPSGLFQADLDSSYIDRGRCNPRIVCASQTVISPPPLLHFITSPRILAVVSATGAPSRDLHCEARAAGCRAIG
jgi:ATP-dependent Lon protease